MVKRTWPVILILLLALGCSKNVDKATNIDKETHSQAEALFEELETPSNTIIVKTEALQIRAPQAGEAVVVEIDTFRVFNDAVSLKEAEIQTRNFVRELALSKALPYDVSLTSLTSSMYVERNQRFDESVAKGVFMMSSSAGRFLKEEFLRKEPIFLPESHSIKYRIHSRSTILPLEKVYNPSMSLKVDLSETLIRSGERIEMELSSNSDGYLYLFDFLSDGSVALVFPRQDMQDNYIEAGQSWKQELGVICEPDKDFIIETLYFVFSKEPIQAWEKFKTNKNEYEIYFSAGEESFILFQNWLAQSDPAKRVEKMVQLHIYSD